MNRPVNNSNKQTFSQCYSTLFHIINVSNDFKDMTVRENKDNAKNTWKSTVNSFSSNLTYIIFTFF